MYLFISHYWCLIFFVALVVSIYLEIRLDAVNESVFKFMIISASYHFLFGLNKILPKPKDKWYHFQHLFTNNQRTLQKEKETISTCLKFSTTMYLIGSRRLPQRHGLMTQLPRQLCTNHGSKIHISQLLHIWHACNHVNKPLTAGRH